MSARPDRPALVAALELAAAGVVAGDVMPQLPVSTGTTRDAAVLVLLGPGDDGEGDVVLLERATGLRAHPGQVAFPGGAVDEADGGDPVSAALREAQEETGLAPDGVEVVGVLPALHLARSRFLVTPVLAWQAVPQPLAAVDAGEVARVLRVPLPTLTDPASRATVRHPSGWSGPAFEVDGLLVWGFTAGLLAAVLRLAGVERPWDASRVLELPDRWAGSSRTAAP